MRWAPPGPILCSLAHASDLARPGWPSAVGTLERRSPAFAELGFFWLLLPSVNANHVHAAYTASTIVDSLVAAFRLGATPGESAPRIPVHVRLDGWRPNLPRRHQFHHHSDCGSSVLPWRYSAEQTPQVSVPAEFDGTGASSYPPAVCSVAPPRAWTTPGVHLVYHPTDESDLRSAGTAASPAPWRSGNLVLSFLSGAALYSQLSALAPVEQSRRSGFPLGTLRAWAAATSSFPLSRCVTVSCPVVQQFTCRMVRFNKVRINLICLA